VIKKKCFSNELGFSIRDPTPLYEDNEAAVTIINDNHPTPRICHLDTQYFAIHEWRHAGIIQMFHIPGIINPADQQTKPLALSSSQSSRSLPYGSLWYITPASINVPNMLES
jgi:hypothetical protein